jgi:hypothetical protein
MKFFVLTFLTFVSLTKQFFLIIDSHTSKCITKTLTNNDNFSGSYLISGENEESSKVYITNDQGIVLWEVFGQKNGSFNMPIRQDGAYMLCVFNQFSKQIAFSFDFIDQNTEDKMASIGNI